MNSMLQDFRGILDGFAYAIYSDSPQGDTPVAQSIINQAYYAHALSPNKGYVKRSVYLQKDWQGIDANLFTGWKPWLITEMSDRDWWRIGGRPVIFLFDPTTWNADATAKANWLSLKSQLEVALNSPLYAVGIGSIDTAAWTALGLAGGTSYDGGLGAAPTPNGQHSWSDQVTKDLSNGGQAGFDIIETVSVRQDNRPRKGEAGTGWSDPATLPDHIAALNTVLGFAIKLVMSPPVTEIDESSGFIKTVQDGTRWLDGVKFARYVSQRPNTYTYTIAARTFYCAATAGTWPRTTGISGAYDGEARRSSTTSDILSLTCDSHILSANSSCTVEPLAEKGPDRGIVEILINGVSQGTVDLYAAGASENNSIGSYTVPSGQRIDFRVNGTKNGSSSGFTCGINAWRVTYNPQN